MRRTLTAAALLIATCLPAVPANAQPLGTADRGEPGDGMIQLYLAAQTKKTNEFVFADARSAADWQAKRPRYQEEYLYMLGLWPMPAKTPLEAKITGTLSGKGYVVDLIHYQSRPRLYVTGNLFRPAQVKPGQRLPAVFYVCGHSGMGRDGNKTDYQSHGIWLARHGYVCLVVDTLQLGEIAGIHHGTYRENRWWWHSRGYTPAGVECLNGMRGIDYLVSRPDVDPARIGVTGISGGGAATFWIAAADPRVKAAVPVSGMSDLEAYVPNRVINGHCDCMFLYNTFQWPWTRIAALVAPRALLFANSDRDPIFPMDANYRIDSRLALAYRFLGNRDQFASLVSSGGHAYRKDIRQGAFRFLNEHLKNDPSEVADSEVDVVESGPSGNRYPIPPEKLRVFPKDSDIPADQLNTTIDRHFVPQADPPPPKAGQFDAWRSGLQKELRRVVFRYFPERVPPGRLWHRPRRDEFRLETEPDIEIQVQRAAQFDEPAELKRILMAVEGPDPARRPGGWIELLVHKGDEVYVCTPRGIGPTRWTRKNPPNYVERCHVLLGRTVDTGRVWDVVAAARFLRTQHGGRVPLYVAGSGAAGVLAAYAALWEPEIDGVLVHRPPRSHTESDAPQLLNVLRVCDVPDVLGMIAPRPVELRVPRGQSWAKTAAAYKAAGTSTLRVQGE